MQTLATNPSPVVYAALPVMQEAAWLPGFLDDMHHQTYRQFHVVSCVNQPDAWWEHPEKKTVCTDNAECLRMLQNEQRFGITLIDRSSPGRGWKGKQQGVGWARRLAMDAAAAMACKHDIIVSVDADTGYGPEYFEEVVRAFAAFPGMAGLSLPYHHPLSGEPAADRAIMRYEIYMRVYALNMLRIGSPYAFTAIGSAMACTAGTYNRLGGITPHPAGEDFYFLQKLRKSGPVCTWTGTRALPAARFSDRVIFGTGPAMIKGSRGDWSSYPVYHASLFGRVRETCQLFNELYEKDLETPMSPFLREIYKTNDLWGPLRSNTTKRERFVRACHQKTDALRILQFLKAKQPTLGITDEECLREFMEAYCPMPGMPEFTRFDELCVEELDRLRKHLETTEYNLRKQNPFNDTWQ